jgi:hypothetical protein
MAVVAADCTGGDSHLKGAFGVAARWASPTLDLRASAALGQTALGAGWRLPAHPAPTTALRAGLNALRAFPALRAVDQFTALRAVN